MRTLRGRLILSHVLPLLLIVPLVGVALAYILETQVLLADLSDDLSSYGELSAEMALSQPQVWIDGAAAQHFVTLLSTQSQSHVMLLDSKGNLLASSEPGYGGQLGQPIDLPQLAAALSGQQQVHVSVSRNVQTDIVQVFVPVIGPQREIMGVVRMSQTMSHVREQLFRLRYIIAAALGVALLLAVALALGLALNLGRSLQRVTDAIYGVASGREWNNLPEDGPQEIRMLLVAFNTLVDRLRLLEESRRRLLANLVHELGRPIGSLHSGIQALLGGADQDAALRHELLEGMDTQVQRLRPLLDSLTDLHDQVLGTLELNVEPVALGGWLRRTVNPWRQAAHDEGLHWRIDAPDSLPQVEFDPDRMAQVLGNLLSNAIKYTPEGTVSVESGVQDGWVTIAVADTGIGIAAVEQERIFEPFYRSRRDKRFPQGMGLGLSIARDLVFAHGGRLDVESTPGEGSRFTIWLPYEPPRDEDPV